MKKLDLESRDETKTAMFELLFSSQSMKREGNQIMELYQRVIDWIDGYKAANGYESFSVMLQLMKSEIFIEKLWKTIKVKGLFCISRHDSLIYKMEDQSEIETLVTEYFNKIGLKCHLKLSDGRRMQIAGEVDAKTEAKTNTVYSVAELKVMLIHLKIHKEYSGVKSAIGMLLDNIDRKTI